MLGEAFVSSMQERINAYILLVHENEDDVSLTKKATRDTGIVNDAPVARPGYGVGLGSRGMRWISPAM